MQSAVLATAFHYVRPSVRYMLVQWYFIQTNEDRITRSSL